MSLPQLVGLPCVGCGKKIWSIAEGKFCTCGNPVHSACLGKTTSASNSACGTCGGDMTTPVAIAVRVERGEMPDPGLAKAAPLRGPFPVSDGCPQCGGGDYTEQRPYRWVAFAKDRVCKQCNIGYAPPTPRWGAILLVVAGVILAAFGAVSVIANAGDGVVGLPALVFEGCLGLLGAAALVAGRRAFIEIGRRERRVRDASRTSTA
jgi:hypothetical protein